MVLAEMAIFMKSRKFFLVASSELASGSSVATAPGEIIVQRIFFGVQLDPEPFSQCAHSGLRGAVNSPAGRKHFDPENGSEVDDVTTLLLQHLRQHGGDPV